MKLVALNISNLTDARYYAARGAEYLTFKFPDTAEQSAVVFKRIQDILEWVEGVKILFHCTAENIELTQKIEIPFEVAGLILPYTFNFHSQNFKSNFKLFCELPLDQFNTISKLKKIVGRLVYNYPIFFTWNDTVKKFDSFAFTLLKEYKNLDVWDKFLQVYIPFLDSQTVYLQIPFKSESGIPLMKTHLFKGVIISSNEETVVGEKDYDEEDAFLDELEELDLG